MRVRSDDSDDNGSVALYWDFENLHASLFEARNGEGSYARPDGRFKVQEPLVDVQAVVDLAASFGPIAINRAYANWQYCGRYRDALLQSAIELIQLFPPGQSAKNGADIRLCLDAMEDLTRNAHIRTILIVGGDSDFMPVAQKIKAAGRTLVGVGTRKSTNRHWAKSCHEFRYYDSLVGVLAPRSDDDEAADQQPAAEMLRRAIALLAEQKGDVWVDKGAVWHLIKRLDSTFDTRDHGHANYSAMVKAMDDVVEVKKGETGLVLRWR